MPGLKLQVVSCIALLVPAFAAGDLIVVPNANTNLTGNAGGSGPLSPPSPGIYQELFGSGQFPGSVDITGISLRAEPGAGALDWTLGDLSIFLSTSSKTPHGTGSGLMSTTFADNIGPDNTLVYSGTNVVLTAPGCAGPGPCAFGPAFTFTTPFIFNPANGVLEAEFVFASLNPLSGQIDAQVFAAPGGPVAQVLEWGNTSAATGNFAYGGNITQFTFQAVPEPATSPIMATGLIALMVTAGRGRLSSHWDKHN